MIIRNNIIWGNTATTAPQISLPGGSASVSYCDVQGGFIGSANFSLPPQLNDTSAVLGANSPCIDAGNPDALYNDAADSSNPGAAAAPSKGLLRNDVGAYGGPGAHGAVFFDLNLRAPAPPKAAAAYSDYRFPHAVQLSWHDPDTTLAGNPLTSFKIRIYRNGTPITDVNSGVQAFEDTGLALHQQYLYYFRTISIIFFSTG